MALIIPIINKSHHPLPAYQTEYSAGLDLRANLDAPIVLERMQRVLIPTGLFLAIPEGYEGQVRPRSGLAFKHGVTVLNSPGTIDADYRGEVKVLLINLGNETFTINDGERIAQLVIASFSKINWETTETLEETTRGTGGYGSTGK